MKTYTISPDGKSITCTRCGKTSHNLNDVDHRYCGFCHQYHDVGPLPKSACPTCGYEVDDASRPVNVNPGERDKPVPGDLSLCLKCGEVLVFQEDMHLSLANLKDFEGIEDYEMKMMDRAQKLIREMRPLG